MNYRETLLQRHRLGLLSWTLVAFGVVFAGRLVYLQIVQHGHYVAEATVNHTRKYEIPANRGQIYALDGATPIPLALNQTLKVVYADPRYVKDPKATAAALARVLGGDAATYRTKLEQTNNYAELATRVVAGQAAAVKALGLPGIGMIDRDYRTYPEGSLGAQVLGFVNADGAGQYGIEGYLDKQLAGTAGQQATETDTNGIPIGGAAPKVVPKDGTSYVLTIDRNIQAEAERQLALQVKAVKAKGGSVIVIDPSNGAVRAMANYPSFDPNDYSSVTDYRAFSNATVSSQFEPGSTVKVLTMAAGLDQGKVTPDTTYNDPGSYKVGDRIISNAEGDKPGNNKTMTMVLRDSLNTGVMFVLRALSGSSDKFSLAGKRVLYDYFTNHFSLGVRTGIEQVGEAAGQIDAPKNTTENDVNYANQTFGQGMSVTMIQMVTAMSAVANGGKLYQPHLVAGTMNADGSVTQQAPKLIRDHVISAKTAAQLDVMLQTVVQHGTGYRAYLENPGYKIGGKTGSAQIPRPDGQGYIEGANIGSFVGYAPVGSPKFVVMVRIDQPEGSKFAEVTTVPLFSSLCQWLFKYYAIPPSS